MMAIMVHIRPGERAGGKAAARNRAKGRSPGAKFSPSLARGVFLGKLFFLALLIIFFFAGCTKVGPDFLRPEAPVAADWSLAGQDGVKAGTADYRNWWESFGDPALNRLIDRAYRGNLSLRMAGVRVLEARAQLGIAVGGLYPQTQQGSGSLQYNKISEHGTQSGFLSQLHYAQDQIGLGASWELDFWGKFRRGVESSNANWLASIAGYDAVLVSLTADVAGAYILLRTLGKRIAIARENVATQEESLKIAEARLKYGTATQLDVEQARTILHNTLAFIPTLEAQRRQVRNFLSVLLGLPPGKPADLVEDGAEIPVSPAQVVVGIPLDLLRRRPDIRGAELQAAAQSARIGVAKADLYPSFSLSGIFGFLTTDAGTSSLGNIFRWGSRTYQFGPSFQWNLFNYGRIKNNIRLQDARFQELLLAYQQTVLTAQQEVEDNLIAFLRAQDRARHLAASAEAARKALALAVLQYQEGIRDFTAVLAAQQSLLAEQDNLASTLGGISASLVGVYRALGGGWEIREGKELVPPEIREEMARRTDWGKLLSPAAYHPPPAAEPRGLIRLPDW
jgi:NodT family efflux transporter outer membrane factor (OMF) lipoprotein